MDKRLSPKCHRLPGRLANSAAVRERRLRETRLPKLSGRCYTRCFAAVAQLDRVLGYEPRGRGFDSCQPHQIEEGPDISLALLVSESKSLE